MTDYDTLEQLYRLRERGALSAEEFESQKAMLLKSDDRDKSPRRRLVLIAAVAALIAGIAFLTGKYAFQVEVVSSQNGQSGNSALVANDPEEEIAVAVADRLAAQDANTNPRATFEWAFSEGIIGLNPAFVESRLGPARSKSGGIWTFEVQDCNVRYVVEAGQIMSVSAPVTADCLPRVGGRVITPQTSFAQLKGPNDTIRASCISSCGNAYDPAIELFQSGYHANGFIDVVYLSNYGDAQDTAMNLWREYIRVSNGIGPTDYDREDFEWFQCVDSPPNSVVIAIGSERIGSVTMGRELTQDGSCRYRS